MDALFVGRREGVFSLRNPLLLSGFRKLRMRPLRPVPKMRHLRRQHLQQSLKLQCWARAHLRPQKGDHSGIREHMREEWCDVPERSPV